MGTCSECRHHRPARPLSQVLAQDFADTAADVSQALAKVVEEEQKQLEAEAGYVRQVAASGGTRWAMPPAMSGWCGLREDHGEFLIAEVRNAGGACTDFEPFPAERPDCTTCRHRVEARGPEADWRRESVYVEIARRNISAGVTVDTTASLLEAHRRAVAARQALEITGLHQGAGTLPEVPGYVDHCAALSVPGRYVACRIENRHRACLRHDQVEEPGPVADEDRPAPDSPPLTGEMADAYLGMLGLADALSRDRPWQPPARDVRDRFAAQLTAEYPAMTAAQQAWLTSLPQQWAELRRRWSQADPVGRRDLAARLVRTVGTADRRRSTADSSMTAIFARQAQEEVELERTDPEQAVQLRLQNRVARAAMRSNAMKLQHQTSMSIIENMK